MKSTAKQRVLESLRTAIRGRTTAELCQPDVGGVRFSARIHELRQEGYEIAEQYLRPGSHLYVLTGEPERFNFAEVDGIIFYETPTEIVIDARGLAA